ncbi:hypothetical protein HGO23_02690 [Xenorhabdus budapestensis]|uniref:Uncharacterized protein n=2 Tax=Xenorhabdus budapestensis TaxID=290110 RepID=A0ABX7VNT2_XENBU|nr:hypothetical protein HGO23_02690 [Xenorhabdus budapestensis]
MSEMEKNAGSVALQILKEKLHLFRDCPEQVLHSTWPIFEHLIERHDEMIPVYEELSLNHVTGKRLWTFMEQCIFAGAYATKENHATVRNDFKRLQTLNKEISETSTKLAQLIEKRDNLLNFSGHFYVNRMIRLTEFIEAAGRKNSLYRSNISPKLRELNEYELKYWPDVPGLLRVLSEESVEIEFADDATAAIVGSIRGSLTDFFRDLFDRIKDISDGSAHCLRPNFRISDMSLATITNVICNVNPENIIDDSYVKRTRQRLKGQDFRAVW